MNNGNQPTEPITHPANAHVANEGKTSEPPVYNEAMFAPASVMEASHKAPGHEHVRQQAPSQPQMAPTNVIYVQQTYFGKIPQGIQCPYCKQSVLTRVHFEVGTGTMLIGLGTFLTCCCLTPLPFMMDACKDVIHVCPSCNAHVGANKVIN
jgi:lipopolysaccharide-induced tumor necrosis factor-alpha factor